MGPLLSFDEAIDDTACPVAASLDALLSSVDLSAIQAAREHPQFAVLYGSHLPEDHAARRFAVLNVLPQAIQEARFTSLLKEDSDPPPPYTHPALDDIQPDNEGMVPLAEFEIIGQALVRRGHAFTMCLHLGSPNSTYWITSALAPLWRDGIPVSVRLDPLLHQPAAEYQQLSYRMWWYGRPLDWTRLSSLKEEEHGRWLPSPLSHESAFTDFVWTPRGDELHFGLEEVPPPPSDVDHAASRYLHAVYLPNSEAIVHLDGAIRIFDSVSLAHRSLSSSHVRNAGKVGTRRKVLRFDAPITTDHFSSLVSAFFVWNYDVARYFGAEIPEDI